MTWEEKKVQLSLFQMLLSSLENNKTKFKNTLYKKKKKKKLERNCLHWKTRTHFFLNITNSFVLFFNWKEKVFFYLSLIVSINQPHEFTHAITCWTQTQNQCLPQLPVGHKHRINVCHNYLLDTNTESMFATITCWTQTQNQCLPQLPVGHKHRINVCHNYLLDTNTGSTFAIITCWTQIWSMFALITCRTQTQN